MRRNLEPWVSQPGQDQKYVGIFYIWMYFSFSCCCLHGLSDIGSDLWQVTSLEKNIYVHTWIFLNSKLIFLKESIHHRRNISQIYPTAVFPMDAFSLRSAICSNYSLTVFVLKAWQVYNHYEKFLVCIFFFFHEGKGKTQFGNLYVRRCMMLAKVRLNRNI